MISTGNHNLLKLVADLMKPFACVVQVDLPSCDASVLSPTTGTGNCNLLVPASYFPAAGMTSVANLVLRIDAPGTTLATSAATSIRLAAAVAHTTLSNVGMLVTVPYRNLHPGE